MQAKQKAIILEQIKNINTLYDVSFLDISKIASEHSEKMLESILIDMKIKQNGLTTLSKEEEILSAYIESETFVIPDSIYEGVLDDDFVDVEDKYAQSLTYDDVPDSFVEKYAENEADDALLELSEDERAARCCEEI